MATTITANGINFPDGSAGSPSIGGSDTNTGLFTGSDIVGFATGGSERLRIDASGNVNIANDSGKLRFGTSADLQIYHDGSNSHISDEGTGSLLIKGDAINLGSTGGEYYIRAFENGAVSLRYDNSTKLETTSSGVTVSGDNSTGSILKGVIRFCPNDSTTVKAMWDETGFSGAGHFQVKDGVAFTAGNSSDLKIYHDSTHSYLSNGTGNLFVEIPDGQKFQVQHGSEAIINGYADGRVELYHDNSLKFKTDSIGCEIAGALIIPDGSESGNRISVGNAGDLKIYHDGSNSYVTHDNGSGHLYLQGDAIRLRTRSATGNEDYIVCSESGAVQIYHNNTHMVSTASDGIQLQSDKRLSRHPNSNSTILQVTNAQYAKSLYIGGWDGGTNSSGISRIRNSNDNLHIDSGSAGQIYLNAYSSGRIRTRHISPMSDNTFDLGQSDIRFDDVFATNGTIQTSDKTKKNTIVDSDLGLLFINKLKPVSYKFNDGTRTHYGLIAQDVETLLSDISKTTTDFAGFIKTDIPDEYYEEAEPNIPDGKKEGDLKSAAHSEYGLRYSEFISPLIKAIQELTTKIEVLEAKVTTLEAA